MLEYVGVWFGTCAILGSLGGVAYIVDKWLERRQFNETLEITAAADNASSPLYAHTNDKYDFKPMHYTQQLVMCGGCGHNIEPGNCPGSDSCPHFSILKVAPGA